MLPSCSAQGYIVLPFEMNKQTLQTLFSFLAAGELVLKYTKSCILKRDPTQIDTRVSHSTIQLRKLRL